MYSAAAGLAQLLGATAYIENRCRLVGLAVHGSVLWLLRVAAFYSRADVTFGDVRVSQLVQQQVVHFEGHSAV